MKLSNSIYILGGIGQKNTTIYFLYHIVVNHNIIFKLTLSQYGGINVPMAILYNEI